PLGSLRKARHTLHTPPAAPHVTPFSPSYNLSLGRFGAAGSAGAGLLRRPARVKVAQLPDLGCVRALVVGARHLEVGGELLERRVREERAEALAQLAFEKTRVAVAVRS